MVFDLLKVALSSLISLIVIFVTTKLQGNKQISELNMFDYVNGITVGSIAAEMATEIESPLKPLTAILVYFIIIYLISKLSEKSIVLRNIFDGTPIILYENDKLYKKNLKKAKININEFLTQCRKNGYFDISQIKIAIMETNGDVSFLPKGENSPVTPKDLKIKAEDEGAFVNVIIDGKIMDGCLKLTGNDENWLRDNLKKQGISQVSDVFLATCDNNNNLQVYKMINEENTKNLFS